MIRLSYLNGYPSGKKKPVIRKYFNHVLYFQPGEEGAYLEYNTKSMEVVLNRISAAERCGLVHPNIVAFRRNVF